MLSKTTRRTKKETITHVRVHACITRAQARTHEQYVQYVAKTKIQKLKVKIRIKMKNKNKNQKQMKRRHTSLTNLHRTQEGGAQERERREERRGRRRSAGGSVR